jgi:hypothetical protein
MIDQILAAGKLVQGKSFIVQENERPVSRTQGNKQCGKDQGLPSRKFVRNFEDTVGLLLRGTNSE